MRWLKLLVMGTLLAGGMSVAAGSPALAATTAPGPAYSFDLAPAATAASPGGGMMAAPGDSIRVSGSGTFDPAAKTVSAKGSFVHYNSSGTVVCQGTWKATGFTSFTDFGANDQGEEGGVLSMVVTHYCKTRGMTMAGIPMTVTSTVNAPAGSTYAEGMTVCDFTQPTGGMVVIQPEQ